MPAHEPTRTSPFTTRLVSPIPPVPHRTTSQLSTVSVSVESPSRNLHKTATYPVGHDKVSTEDKVQISSESAGSSGHSSDHTHDDASPRGVRTPGSSATSSRKGKEKALKDVGLDEVEVSGEMVMTSDDAAKELRELVRKSTVSDEVSRKGRSFPRDLVELEKPIGEQILGELLIALEDGKFTLRRYYVLTNAGKPVYRSCSPPTLGAS